MHKKNDSSNSTKELIKGDNHSHLSTITKIKNFDKILKPREKFIVYIATLFFILAIIGGSVKYYLSATEAIPTIGGEYIAGIPIDSEGLPTTINPILSMTRPVDELLSSIIFSSLFTYNNQGQLVNDLTENYEISEDGKKYTIHLKDNVLWHDGEKLTSNDIVFTAKLLQDASYNPVNTKEWDSEKIKISNPDDKTIIFDISEPYAPFLSRLTFGILPKHIWSKISADQFSLVDLNLEPVGSGPFIFEELKKNASGDIITYKLIASEHYYNKKPYLEKLILKFYKDQESVINAYNQKEISGFGFSDYNKTLKFKERNDTSVYTISTPQYFPVLLNQTKSIPLADYKVREALQHATNRDELIEKVFNGYADKIYSPLIKPFISENFDFDNSLMEYSPDKAKKLLENSGWKKKDGEKFRKKNGEELKIKLVTTNTTDLSKTVELLKKQWGEVGVNVEIIESNDKLNIRQDYLNPREYESILLGLEYSGNDPNLFFFWHSTGKKNPGLNFALYENEKTDKLLEESKKMTTPAEKNKKYIEVSKQLLKDNPAIFLYSPKYIYIMNKKIKGVNLQAIVKTTSRFNDITNWYTKTKRVRK
jgi:peptide/nickel transport system substrate-binding protein